MKTIQLLPGVQTVSEGTSGLYVRGGGPDQNLILLDGVLFIMPSTYLVFFLSLIQMPLILLNWLKVVFLQDTEEDYLL